MVKTVFKISAVFFLVFAVAGCLSVRQNPTCEEISFTYNGVEKSLALYSPDSSVVSADRYITLKGHVKDPENRDYALITVNKSGENHPYYRYLVKGGFEQNIWFRYGAGSYSVKLYSIVGAPLVFKDYRDFSGRTFEGDISIVCGTSEQYRIEVTAVNLSSEKSADTPDCRFLYPSYEIPSDSPLIAALSDSICAGKSTDEEKVFAIHEYIMKNVSYDNNSTAGKTRRKKQDALSVLENRVAVCEGYAKLFAALTRAQGIPAAFMEGKAWNGQHAWNNVWIDGTWRLVDATQNDAENYLEYFLRPLDSFRGIKDSHDGNSGDDFYEDDSFFPLVQ